MTRTRRPRSVTLMTTSALAVAATIGGHPAAARPRAATSVIFSFDGSSLGGYPDSDLVMFVGATNREQSKDNAYRNIARRLDHTAWFATYLAAVGAEEIALWTPADLAAAGPGGPSVEDASIRVFSHSAVR